MEQKQNVVVIVIGLVVGLLVGYASGSALVRMPMMYQGPRDVVAPNNSASNNTMHAMRGEMMVGSEKEFLLGMIPHHEEAVATAQEVLARGATTPEIKALVENIITSQTNEIAMMKVWYQEWYGEPYVATGEYHPMMRDLSQLSGVALDRTFLEDMVQHHMGALMMAKSVDTIAEHDALHDLAHEIEEVQTREIALMQQYLATLPQ